MVKFLTIVLISLFASLANALDLRLTWAPASEFCESNTAGYKLYYGFQSGAYGEPIDVGNVLEYDLLGLENKIYYFAVSAYEAGGMESQKSREFKWFPTKRKLNINQGLTVMKIGGENASQAVIREINPAD